MSVLDAALDSETGANGVRAGAQRTPRLRIRYSKLGKVRFTSHRDIVRIWERALRRSGVQVAWSKGFSPHPLLAFGLALPTGCESLGEYLDVRLVATPGDSIDVGDDPVLPGKGGLGELPCILSSLLPEGIEVQSVGLDAHGTSSLQEEVTSCSWEMEVREVSAEQLADRVDRLLGTSRVFVTRERKGVERPDDIRPAVLKLACLNSPRKYQGSSATSGARLYAETATRPRGVRPMELVKGLGDDLVLSRAIRTHQWIDCEGVRSEPLDIPGGPPAPLVSRTEECAS